MEMKENQWLLEKNANQTTRIVCVIEFTLAGGGIMQHHQHGNLIEMEIKVKLNILRMCTTC